MNPEQIQDHLEALGTITDELQNLVTAVQESEIADEIQNLRITIEDLTKAVNEIVQINVKQNWNLGTIAGKVSGPMPEVKK